MRNLQQPDLLGPPDGALPGFIACANSDAGEGAGARSSAFEMRACGPAILATWGFAPVPGSLEPLVLSRVTRTAHGEVTSAEIARRMQADPAALTGLLPPFAAVRGDGSGVTMVADSVGFRQLYHSTPGADGVPVLSSSALMAGLRRGADLDDTAVAVQSLVGWQLGQRTLFSGVEKLIPGGIACLDGSGVHVSAPPVRSDRPIALRDAVMQAADVLRTSLEALLEDHPEAVLQLTGGQDSRLLLSAVPTRRRRGLRAMTVGVPGSGDVAIARQLAERCGLRHEVHGLAPLDGLSPDEAWKLTTQAAIRLDGMSDPVALAAMSVAERSFDQGVRISGVAGEVARGFYYVGAVHERPIDRKAAERLAAWRLFVNEAAEPAMLRPEFAEWARRTALDEVADALIAGGPDWFRATDELYLRHRVQRWAGVTDTAVGFQRTVINPMLAPEFLDIATRLAPADKARSRFLAELQMELDPELGRIPLDGRPAPAAAAQPGAWQSFTRTVATGRRLAKKAAQRVRQGNRPPAGGVVLAEKVVEHWRDHPELLASSRLEPFLRQDWIEKALDGRLHPRTSSVAFLTNLIVAGQQSPARVG